METEDCLGHEVELARMETMVKLDSQESVPGRLLAAAPRRTD